MTVLEAINRLDAIKPNSYSQSEKIKWLSTLDGIIKSEIMDTHEHNVELKENPTTGKVDLYAFDIMVDSFTVNNNGEYVSSNGKVYKSAQAVITAGKAMNHPFNGYTDGALGKTLIVGAPYDDIYVKWLEAQIDYANGEYGKYNNTKTMYGNAYDSFARAYHREHKPKSSGGFTNF